VAAHHRNPSRPVVQVQASFPSSRQVRSRRVFLPRKHSILPASEAEALRRRWPRR
jgi:hypothetical protein